MKFFVMVPLIIILSILSATTASRASPQARGLSYWNLVIKWEYNIAFDHEMGYEPHNPPIIADVDSDGSPEVVVHGLTFSRGFIVLDGATGREEWRADLPGDTVMVTNLDSDPQMELLLHDPGLYCVDGKSGQVQWSFTAGSPISAVMVADVNGDGVREVVAVSMWEISILGPEGKLLNVISYQKGFYRPFGHASGDLDGDGRDEIVLSSGDEVLVLKGAKVVGRYAHRGDHITHLSLADLDGDGQVELVATSTSPPWMGGRGRVMVLDRRGRVRWSREAGAGRILPPCITDLNGDGRPDLVLGFSSISADTTTGRVTALTGGGDELWSVPLPALEGPACGDLNGDGKADVLIADTGGNVVTLNGENGESEWSLQLVASSPSVGDVDGDGGPEVVVGSGQDEVYCLDGTDVHLHLSLVDSELLVSWSFDERPVNLYYPVTVRVLSGGHVVAEKTSTRPPVRLKLWPGDYTVELLYGDQLMTRGRIRMGHPGQVPAAVIAVLALVSIAILWWRRVRGRGGG